MFGIIQSLCIIEEKIIAGRVRGLDLLIPAMLDHLPHMTRIKISSSLEKTSYFMHDGYTKEKCSGLIRTANILVPLHCISA